MAPLLLSVLFGILAEFQFCLCDTEYYEVGWTRSTAVQAPFHAANASCSYRGKYLASIHSTEQNDLLAEMCGDTNYSCWIGLVIDANSEISWIDDSDINTKFINESFCEGVRFDEINEKNKLEKLHKQ